MVTECSANPAITVPRRRGPLEGSTEPGEHSAQNRRLVVDRRLLEVRSGGACDQRRRVFGRWSLRGVCFGGGEQVSHVDLTAAAGDIPTDVPSLRSDSGSTVTRLWRRTPLVVMVLTAKRRSASLVSCDDDHTAARARVPKGSVDHLVRWLRVFPGGSSSGLGTGVEHVHLSEPDRRTAVADRRDLTWLTLAAVEGPSEHVGGPSRRRRPSTPRSRSSSTGRRRLSTDP